MKFEIEKGAQSRRGVPECLAENGFENLPLIAGVEDVRYEEAELFENGADVG